jgi:hypothetical protein
MYGILVMLLNKYQEKTERTIKDGQSRETGSIVHTRHKMKIKKCNTTCGEHHYV